MEVLQRCCTLIARLSEVILMPSEKTINKKWNWEYSEYSTVKLGNKVIYWKQFYQNLILDSCSPPIKFCSVQLLSQTEFEWKQRNLRHAKFKQIILPCSNWWVYFYYILCQNTKWAPYKGIAFFSLFFFFFFHKIICVWSVCSCELYPVSITIFLCL